eukprot:SAG11_NODE_25307_length_360_cov_1.567050_2_plen_46_part_01
MNFGEIDGLSEIAAALKREKVNTTADLYSKTHYRVAPEPLDASGIP